MNEQENPQTIENIETEETQEGAAEETSGTGESGFDGVVTVDSIMSPVDVNREQTLIMTPKGNITIIHEITLGDILVIVSIMSVLILNFFKAIRR